MSKADLVMLAPWFAVMIGLGAIGYALLARQAGRVAGGRRRLSRSARVSSPDQAGRSRPPS